MITKTFDLTAGKFQNVKVSLPYKWVAIIQANGLMSFKATDLDVAGLAQSSIIPTNNVNHGMLKIASDTTETVNLGFGDERDEMPRLPSKAGVSPLGPINAKTVFDNNSGSLEYVSGNADGSPRVGQPNLNSVFNFNENPGDQPLFEYLGNAYGSMNGIWFKVLANTTDGTVGFKVIPSHDTTDRSADADFDPLGTVGYLRLAAGGYKVINLADYTYKPVVGDVFYVPLRGRQAIYMVSQAIGVGLSFSFQVHFNYGTEPEVHNQTVDGTLLVTGDVLYMWAPEGDVLHNPYIYAPDTGDAVDQFSIQLTWNRGTTWINVGTYNMGGGSISHSLATFFGSASDLGADGIRIVANTVHSAGMEFMLQMIN